MVYFSQLSEAQKAQIRARDSSGIIRAGSQQFQRTSSSRQVNTNIQSQNQNSQKVYFSQLSEAEKAKLRSKDSFGIFRGGEQAIATKTGGYVVAGKPVTYVTHSGEKYQVPAGQTFQEAVAKSQKISSSQISTSSKAVSAGEMIKMMRATGDQDLVSAYSKVAPSIPSSIYESERLPSDPLAYPRNEKITITMYKNNDDYRDYLAKRQSDPLARYTYEPANTSFTNQFLNPKPPSSFFGKALYYASYPLPFGLASRQRFSFLSNFFEKKWEINMNEGNIPKARAYEVGSFVLGTIEPIVKPESIPLSIYSATKEIKETGGLPSVGESLRQKPVATTLSIVTTAFGSEFALGKLSETKTFRRLGFVESNVPTSYELAEQMATERAISKSKIITAEKMDILRSAKGESYIDTQLITKVERPGIFRNTEETYIGRGFGKAITEAGKKMPRGFAEVDVVGAKIPKGAKITESGKLIDVVSGEEIKPKIFETNVQVRSQAGKTKEIIEGIKERPYTQKISTLTKNTEGKTAKITEVEFIVAGKERFGGDIFFREGKQITILDENYFKLLSGTKLKSIRTFEITEKTPRPLFGKEIPQFRFEEGKFGATYEEWKGGKPYLFTKSAGRKIGEIKTSAGIYELWQKKSISFNEKIFKNLLKQTKEIKNLKISEFKKSEQLKQPLKQSFSKNFLFKETEKIRKKYISSTKEQELLQKQTAQKSAFEYPELKQVWEESIKKDLEISMRLKAKRTMEITRSTAAFSGLSGISSLLKTKISYVPKINQQSSFKQFTNIFTKPSQSTMQFQKLKSETALSSDVLYKTDLTYTTPLIFTKLSTSPLFETSPISPYQPPSMIPNWPYRDINIGWGLFEEKKRKRLSTKKYIYNPSLSALFFGIKGKQPKVISGYETRPITKGWIKRIKNIF